MPDTITHEYQFLTVTVRSNDYWFTVTDTVTGCPRGTLERPSRFFGNNGWVITAPDGTKVAETMGPRTALRRLASHIYRRD